MNYLVLGLFVSISTLLTFLPATAEAKGKPLEGTISIEIEDYEDHAQLKYWLKDNQGKRTEILLEKQPSWLRTGQKLRVHGNPQGKKFAVEDESISLLLSTDTSTNTTSTTSTNKISGVRNLLIVEIHPPSDDVEMISRSTIENIVLTKGNNYFQEASYGALSLIGDISPPIIVDYDTSVCNTNEMATKADDVLRGNGYEPGQYDHVMYLIPYTLCGWSGKGNVAGPRSWIRRFSSKTVIHELGHNLGLFHANKKDCGAQTTNSNECTITEYGDPFTAMGNATTPYHYNSFHKEQLGWLENKTITLTNDGTITLSPLEENSITPKLLKILKNIDSNGNSEWYYIEYRQAIGFDSGLSTYRSHQLIGVRLREGVENSPNTSALLDPRPQSTSYDWDDITIAPGETYFDEQNNINISVISSSVSGVTIDVTFDSQSNNTCSTQKPSITALSGNATNVLAGDIVSFNYSVSNNDSSNCPDAIFDISSSLPDSWEVSLSHSQLSLTAGSSSNITLYVTVALNEQEGTYAALATAQRSNSLTQVSAENLIQVVNSGSTPINLAPVAVSDTVFISSKNTVTFNVLSNDYDPDSDSIKVVSTSQGSKGSVYLNNDDSISYVPAKSFKLKDSFSYTISDGEYSATTIVYIELQSGNDSDGNTRGKGKKK